MIILTRDCYPSLGFVKGAEVKLYKGDAIAVGGGGKSENNQRYYLAGKDPAVVRIWLNPEAVIDSEDQSDPRNDPVFSKVS